MNKPGQMSSYYGSDEGVVSKFVNKVKREPFFVAGVGGLITVCGIGVYKWKTRKISTQHYLIQLRLAAQGAAVGCLVIGMVYNVAKDLFKEKK